MTAVYPQYPTSMSLPWVVRLVVLYLGAITIFGKGPTYLIYPPLFWGEMVMVAAMVWLVDRHGAARAFVPYLDLLTASVAAFMTVGLLITIQWFPLYQLDAVRDAAIWYYGAFFFVGAQMAKDIVIADRVWSILRMCWIAGMFWGIGDELSGLTLSRIGPVVPWRGEPLLSNSHYEIVQHMGLASIIVLNPMLSQDVLGRWRSFFVPAGVLGLVLAFVSSGRGVRLGLGLSVVAMLALHLAPGRTMEISRRLMTGIVPVLLLALCLVAVLPSEDNQALAKMASLDRFTETRGVASNNATWRYIWWERLFDEVLTTNPVLGLGFGPSLNVYNPLLKGNEREQWPVRSPHNFNITIFSRMGLAGLACWMLVLATGFMGIYKRIWSGRSGATTLSPHRREELAFWFMMLTTTWVNASLGVLMEGPVLGIWFWFALGFAWTRSHPASQPIEKLVNTSGGF